jgi:hypothetical protein
MNNDYMIKENSIIFSTQLYQVFIDQLFSSQNKTKGLSCHRTPKFGWTGNAKETAAAWKGDDGDDDSEDVEARVSSCPIDPFQRHKKSGTTNRTGIACKTTYTK